MPKGTERVLIQLCYEQRLPQYVIALVLCTRSGASRSCHGQVSDKLPFRSRHPQKTAQESSKTAQDGAKTAQDGPIGPKTAPRSSRDGSKTRQDGPKTAQYGVKTAQDSAKTAHRLPKSTQRTPQRTPQRSSEEAQFMDVPWFFSMLFGFRQSWRCLGPS